MRKDSRGLLGLVGLLALLALAGAPGCGDDSVDGPVGGGGNGGEGAAGQGGNDGPPEPEIVWRACPEGELDELQCADVELPLDWSDLEGRTLAVHVRRLQASEEPVRGAIWLLEGGPGAPGAWLLDYAARIHAAHPRHDLFVPDHRGTGQSTPLACSPQTDPPTPACIASLDDQVLLHVNSSDAARDVAALARWTARADELSLYGRSYGTYWAHRTVSLAPGLFDALVLDSPCSPIDGCPASARDAGQDAVGRAFLARCTDDPACDTHLGSDAVGFAEGAIAAADQGSCQAALDAGLDGVRLRYILAQLLSGEQTRGLVPAVLLRVQRCAPSDGAALAALAAYFEQVDALTESALQALSLPTNYQVTFAEWWDEGFGVAQAEAELADTVLATGASLRWARAFQGDRWQALPRDPALRSWQIESLPTLVLVGGLDMATPRASVASDKPTMAPGSHWVELAFAGHVSSASDGPYGSCARGLIDDFLDQPGAALDDACVAQIDAQVEPTLFDVSPSLASTLLGTTDPYGAAE